MPRAFQTALGSVGPAGRGMPAPVPRSLRTRQGFDSSFALASRASRAYVLQLGGLLNVLGLRPPSWPGSELSLARIAVALDWWPAWLRGENPKVGCPSNTKQTSGRLRRARRRSCGALVAVSSLELACRVK